MFRPMFLTALVAFALVPAGVARADTQYRVNYRTPGVAAWSTYTTTVSAAQAEQTAATLQQDGYQAVVVAVPTATGPFVTNYTYSTAPIVTGGTGTHAWYNSSYYVNHPYWWNYGWHNGWNNSWHGSASYGWHGGWHNNAWHRGAHAWNHNWHHGAHHAVHHGAHHAAHHVAHRR